MALSSAIRCVGACCRCNVVFHLPPAVERVHYRAFATVNDLSDLSGVRAKACACCRVCLLLGSCPGGTLTATQIMLRSPSARVPHIQRSLSRRCIGEVCTRHSRPFAAPDALNPLLACLHTADGTRSFTALSAQNQQDAVSAHCLFLFALTSSCPPPPFVCDPVCCRLIATLICYPFFFARISAQSGVQGGMV
jgi:hypothetical protein